METNYKKFAIIRPFVDRDSLMETIHQLSIQQRHRDYKMRKEGDYNARYPITHPKSQRIVAVETSKDEEMSTPSETEGIPAIVPGTREEIKKRRRQELLDNHDTEPVDSVVDELLESQVQHYKVLQRRGITPIQAKSRYEQREDQKSEDKPDFAPRYRDCHKILPIPQYLGQNKMSKSSREKKNMSTIGKSGLGITKRGHVAKKKGANMNNEDLLELMFKGIEDCSRTLV